MYLCERESSDISYNDTSPVRTQSLMILFNLHCFLRGPSSNTIPLGLNLQAMNWRQEDTNIQPIKVTFKENKVFKEHRGSILYVHAC